MMKMNRQMQGLVEDIDRQKWGHSYDLYEGPESPNEGADSDR